MKDANDTHEKVKGYGPPRQTAWKNGEDDHSVEIGTFNSSESCP